MGRRVDFHNVLVGILGSNNVYFQPPETAKIQYPAIIYSRNNIKQLNADNLTYLAHKRYKVIFVSADPDDDIVDKLAMLPMCTWNSHYVADNLNHDVFSIYY